MDSTATLSKQQATGQNGISETVSEKPKRGRPPAFPPELFFLASTTNPDVVTKRGKQNLYYQQEALHVLLDDPRFYWITGGSLDDVRAGRGGKLRRRILQCLGRLADGEDIKAVALEICRLKPTARQADATIRQYRGVSRSAGDVLELANRIIDTVNDYLRVHPTTSWHDVASAMHTASGKVADAMDADR